MAWLAALHSLNYLKTFAEGDEEKAESELKMNMEDVEARLSHAIEQGGLKDREIKSVRRQLDSRDDELAEMTRGREVALKENRRLQTDLNAMTEEHQAIHQQLQEALEEQESLKVQISEYARQVARVEELLAQKEQEKEELLEQYQVLSSEAERLVTESKVSAGKVTNYHMELVQKQRSEMELSDKIRRLEGEIQQVRVSLMNKRQQMRRDDVMHPQIASARFVK